MSESVETIEWKALIQQELSKDYMKNLSQHLKRERAAGKTVFPAPNEYFRAFDLVPFDKVKVVIIGQDPYHDGNANGMAFSCKQKLSPSLRNIKKELQEEYNLDDATMADRFTDDELNHWAAQGVLLINTCLSVENGNPGSHAGIGWERFTKTMIDALYNDNTPKVFMCWGEHAKKVMQAKSGELHNPMHNILTSAHPSPFSAHKGFFGNNHFKLASQYVEKMRDDSEHGIDWFNIPF